MTNKSPVSLRQALSLSLAILAPAVLSGPLLAAADPSITRVLAQNFAGGCLESTKTWPVSQRQDFAERLGQNGMTIDDFCSCAAKRVFGSLSQSEVNRFLRDSSKYQGTVADREPWKSRIEDGNRLCLAGHGAAEN